MNGLLYAKRFFLLLSVLWLAGCQISPDRVTPLTSTLPPQTPGISITEPIMPGVLIHKGKSKAILDAVVRERLKRKMQVKVRDTYSVTMALTVPNTTKLTEAQMVYSLYRYQEGLWLSARVYQIVEPGTVTEKILDVTRRVETEMQHELNKIAKQFVR
jgi:hypothetical protein